MVNSQCLRSKVKLVCVLKSLGRNVIMQVLFPAAVIVLVPVHWLLAGKSCILMRAKANWLIFTLETMFYLPLSFSFFISPLLHNFLIFPQFHNFLLFSLLNLNFPLPPQFYYFPSSFILYIFPSTKTSTSDRPYSNPKSTPHRPYSNPRSTLDNFSFSTQLCK